MKTRSSRLSWSALLLGTLFVSGCGSLLKPPPDPARYFLLQAPAAPAPDRAEDSVRPLTLGLRRIELPSYLRSSAIALRPGGTEVRYSEVGRWAEPLGQGLARVLQETLARSPAVASIAVYPAPYAQAPEYEISVRIVACEGVWEAGRWRARFAARWEIRSTRDGSAGSLVAAEEFVDEGVEWAEGDFAAFTARIGAAVEAMGARWIEALRTREQHS